jgi:hypothetical protein
MLNKHEMYKEKVKYTLDKNKNNYEVNEENKKCVSKRYKFNNYKKRGCTSKSSRLEINNPEIKLDKLFGESVIMNNMMKEISCLK